jgi:hypothetical protein
MEDKISHLVDPATSENIIKRWYEDWQFYNERVINMMEKAGVLNPVTAQDWREMADYFPFYRVTEDVKGEKKYQAGENVFGSMTQAVGFRELRGGTTPVNMPMLEAMTLNLSASIQMSLRNIAQQRVVRDMVNLGLGKMLRPNQPNMEGQLIKFRINGAEVRAEIFDPLVYESLLPLDGTDFVRMVRSTFGMPATALRELVTRDPGFMLVNLMRDTLSAAVTSGSGVVPVVGTFKGLFDGVEKLEALGVVGGYDYSNDPDNILKHWDKLLRQRGINRDGKMHPLGMLTRMWDYVGRGTTASDAATRNAVWNKVYQDTGDIAEASMQAMEVINFGRHGRNTGMRVLTAVIPFLNARIQGVDVFWRAFTGRYSAKAHSKGRIAASALARASLLSGATMAYYLLVGDDDQYKEAPDFVKDNYWLFPTKSGVPFRLPIPFEVGLFFKTIPETVLARLMSGKDDYDIRTPREAKDTLKRGVVSTLEISPFQIQFMGPIMEAVTNYNSFTGRQVVPQYLMENKEAGAQSEVWTNELAKWIGEKWNISPMKAQHVMEGYAGTVGTYLLDMIDATMKTESVQGDKARLMPKRPWYEYPVIKRFFGKLNDKAFMQDAYELNREVNKVYSTYTSMLKEGRGDEAQAYIHNRQIMLGMRGNMANLKGQLDKMRKYRDLILRSDMSAEEKRREIDEIESQMNQVLREVMPVMEEMANMPFYDTYYRD